MSEHDRGAYTPPTDDYLAFDARAPQVRRPIPATLLGSAVVLVVLVGAVVLFYRSGVRGANEAPEAVGKPVGMSIKSAPVSDAKPLAEDGQGYEVYNQEKGQAAATPAKPAFAPPPEQPAARVASKADSSIAPAPPAMVQPTRPSPPTTTPATSVPATPPTKTAVAPEAAQPSARTAAAAAPLRQAQPTPKVATASAKARPDAIDQLLTSATKPAHVARTAPAPEAAAKGAAPSGTLVQIGAFSSPAIADDQFAKTKAAFAEFTAHRPKHVERIEKDGKVFYRAAFTGFTKPEAQAFCRALITAKKACIVR